MVAIEIFDLHRVTPEIFPHISGRKFQSNSQVDSIVSYRDTVTVKRHVERCTVADIIGECCCCPGRNGPTFYHRQRVSHRVPWHST